jgi:hypothetical protein
MDAQERLDALEGDVTGIRTQLDSLKLTIETLVRTLQSGPPPSSTPVATPIMPNDSALNVRAGMCTHLKPLTPADFNGVRAQGRAFLNSCELYISLQADQFPDDAAKIYWAFTYMKSERAYLYVDHVLRQTKERGSLPFLTWGDFWEEFI